MKLKIKNVNKLSVTTFGIASIVVTPILATSCFRLPNKDTKDDLTEEEKNDKKIVDVLLVKISDIKTNKTDTLPSKLRLSSSPTQSELGVEWISESEISSKLVTVTITIDRSKINDDTGSIGAKVQITKNTQSLSKEVTITGYLSQIEHNNNKVDEQINSIQSTYITSKSVTTTFEISTSIGSLISETTLGISIPDIQKVTGVTYVFKLLEKNSQMGELLVELIVSAEKVQSKSKNIRISGFKPADEDYQTINSVLERVAVSYTTVKTNMLTSEIGLSSGVVTENKLGINTLLTTGELNGCSYQITINSNSDIDEQVGVVNVSVKVAKNEKFLEKLITVNGFFPKNLKDVRTQLDLINSVSTGRSDTLPSIIGNVDSIVTKEQLGISFVSTNNNVSLEYKITQINNIGGWLMLKVKASKGNSFEEKEIQVSGFRNQSTQDIIDVSNMLTNKTTTLVGAIPSNATVGLTINPTLYGFSEPSDKKGTTITYKIKTINSSEMITVTATITKSQGTTVAKDFTISGFAPSSVIGEINNVLSQITDKSTNKTTISPTSIGQVNSIISESDLGINAFTNTLQVSIVLKIKTINENEGTILVSVEASKGGSSNTKDILISGFKKATFITADSAQAGEATIKNSYFGTTKMNLGDQRFNFSNGATFNSYIVELNNGTKFVFETGNGVPGFFDGYNFTVQNEDQTIKTHLHNYVNDAVKHLVFGNTSRTLEIVYSPFAPGNEGTLGTTNSSLWGFNQIWMNYSYWDIRQFSSLRKNTEWGFDNKVNALLGHNRNYWESITTLAHEMGHMEIDSAIGNFYNDDYAIRKADRTLDGVNKNYGATFKETRTGYDGAALAGDLIAIFQKYGVDLSSVLGGMKDVNNFWESTNNASLTFIQPTLAEADQYIQAIYGKDIRQSLSEAYDNSYSQDNWTKLDLSNKNVNWTYNGGGTIGSVNYATGKDWFINSGYNIFLEKYGKWGNSNTSYIFNIHEFLTRMNGLLMSNALKNGTDLFAESLVTMYSNALYSNPWSTNPLDANGSATTNGENLVNYVNSNTGRIANRSLRDSVGSEIFHFASRLGNENVTKILNNRDKLLEEFIQLIYGGGEKVAFENTTQLRKDSSNFQHLDKLKVFGVTKTKNKKFQFGLRKDINNLNEFIVPQDEYKPVVWKNGHNKIHTGLYYYNVEIPVGIALSNVLYYQNSMLVATPSLMPNWEPIITINSGSWNSNFSRFYNEEGSLLTRVSYGTTGTNRLTYPQVMNDPSSNSMIYIPMFKE